MTTQLFALLARKRWVTGVAADLKLRFMWFLANAINYPQHVFIQWVMALGLRHYPDSARSQASRITEFSQIDQMAMDQYVYIPFLGG